MSSRMEELAVLREETDVLVQQTVQLQENLQPVESADASGEVTVKIDANGSISSVKVGFAWEQKLRRADLSPAVMEALSGATALRMEQYGDAATRAENEPPPRARPAAAPSTVAELHDRFTDAPDEAGAAERFLENILAEAIEGLVEANEIISAHVGAVHTGRSSSGHVRASVTSGGSLQSLDIDDVWLARAHPANLSREITEAITTATDRAHRNGLASALEASKLAQVAAQTVGLGHDSNQRED